MPSPKTDRSKAKQSPKNKSILLSSENVNPLITEMSIDMSAVQPHEQRVQESGRMNKRLIDKALPVKQRMHSLYSPAETLYHKVQRAESKAKNRSRLGTRENKVAFCELDGVGGQTPANLITDYDSLTKAVAVSALVEKPQTVKNSKLKRDDEDTFANYFSCQIQAVGPCKIPFPATVSRYATNESRQRTITQG